MDNKVTIKIPRELYRRLSSMTADTGFSSVTELIVFVMRSIASGEDTKEENGMSSAEVRAIKQRLRRLGYLKD